MSYESSTGLGVATQYGVRNTGGSNGLEQSSNAVQKMSFNLTGEMLNSTFNPPVYMPKGAKVQRCTLRVDEVFVISAAGTVAVGGTAPGTDGVVLTEAKLEALGTSDVSSLAVGTWATSSTTGPLTTQKVTKAVTGTAGATAGKATLIVEYLNVTKV